MERLCLTILYFSRKVNEAFIWALGNGAENMKYSEQEKDVSVACNSEVWEDIGQDTMVHYFYVP